jgi:hypothetical protein
MTGSALYDKEIPYKSISFQRALVLLFGIGYPVLNFD